MDITILLETDFFNHLPNLEKRFRVDKYIVICILLAVCALAICIAVTAIYLSTVMAVGRKGKPCLERIY